MSAPGSTPKIETEAMPRRGRWTYGDHPGLNPGWRLDGTNLVLDQSQGEGYILWTDGRPGDAIDRYLDGAMRYVEKYIEPEPLGESDDLRGLGLGVIWDCDGCRIVVETELDDTPDGWLIEEYDEDDYPEPQEIPDDLILCTSCRLASPGLDGGASS
jgi:hypothetical protein